MVLLENIPRATVDKEYTAYVHENTVSPRPKCNDLNCEWREQFFTLEDDWSRLWNRVDFADATMMNGEL